MEEPRLLIADEPTPGMDDESAAVAAHDLRAFAQDGGGVLLITHALDFALSVADRLAVFREGTVVEETSVSAFRRAEALREDDESAAVAAHDLRAFAQDGGGVLLITHALDFALSVADRLAVFREGTVVEETSVSAFRRAEALRDPYARELSRAWIEPCLDQAPRGQ